MKKFHGLLSITLMFFAYFLAVYSVIKVNWLIGLLFITIIILLFLVIAYFYCAKCSCRDNCSHVIVGRLTKLFPERKDKNYTIIDYILTLIALLAITLIPQYWLFQNKILFIIFWIINFIALTDIVLFVCKTCNNDKCFLCKNRGE